MGNKASKQPVLSPENEKYRSFPGSAILEKTFCGNIDTTDPSEYENSNVADRLWKKANIMCISSPTEADRAVVEVESVASNYEPRGSRLLARALVNEVTDNPKTMTAEELTNRERKLLKAQKLASKQPSGTVGAPGVGVGPPQVFNSIAYAVTGEEVSGPCLNMNPTKNRDDILAQALVESGGALPSNGIALAEDIGEQMHQRNPHALTIAVVLSRRSPGLGHPDTVTRQTAFDFNELQDRDYEYISATDSHGWRAGGGEGTGSKKSPHIDVAHVPILHMDCADAAAVDHVIHTLASGDVFIPHMSVLPDSLAVHGSPLPDICLNWPCERNEDVPVDDWPNWCLEFVHNQLFEFFYESNAKPQWTPRPFSMTMAKSVRWKTVKHMNQYFRRAEKVLSEWREGGPQFLDPQHSYMDGGASPEEVSKPHGLYIMRRDPVSGMLQPTNYFPPNFDPPYTTKMTRSLLENVLNKSWDQRRREWSSQAQPRLVSPGMLLAAACGCGDNSGGYVAKEVTNSSPSAKLPSGLEEPPIVIVRSFGKEVGRGNEGESLPERRESPSNSEEKKVDDIASLRTEGDDSEVMNALRKDRTVERKPEASPAAKPNLPKPTEKAQKARIETMRSGEDDSTQEEAKPETKARLFSDEDWTNVSPEQSPTSDPPGNKGMLPPHWVKKSPERLLDKERRRQEEMSTNQKIKPSSKYRMQPNPSSSPRSPTMSKSGSGTSSLEYSMDTNQPETLLGQMYTNAVSSESTPQSAATTPVDDNDEHSTALSLQTSGSSYMSVVPTDEELFAIGWAKAMDPKSGNFYYFTLDRQKIVWESPLTNPQVPVDAPGA